MLYLKDNPKCQWYSNFAVLYLEVEEEPEDPRIDSTLDSL